MTHPATASVALGEATKTLAAAHVPDAARDARRLLAHALGIDAGRLTLALPEPISAAQLTVFRALIDRRRGREPVSHLTGQRQFYGRAFLVTPDVLDPRPETEILIEAALSAPFETVLDLGTGSGCIALTLLAETTGSRAIAVDLSEDALQVAKDNAVALDVSARVHISRSYWFDDVSGSFDLIVSNPPYIADYEMEDLAPEVRDHEPRMALTDEADGLEAYRAIFAGAATHLNPEGRIIVEIGQTQASDVSKIATDAGFKPVTVLQDLDGRDRVVVCILPDFGG